jgi:hypothetical protein
MGTSQAADPTSSSPAGIRRKAAGGESLSAESHTTKGRSINPDIDADSLARHARADCGDDPALSTADM